MGIESENNFKSQFEKAPIKIAEIAPIEESRNTWVRDRKHLKELVEAPLLSACEVLWDKNIRTLSTSANTKDIKYGSAHLIIDFDSLSDENKKIGENLGEVFWGDNMNQLKIEIPVTESSTTNDIKSLADSIAHKFGNQKMTWAPFYTLEQVRRIYGIDPNDEAYGVDDFTSQFHYDSERKLFFLSEEHARKSKD
ncbi:MAG: hypothetical protein ACD_81C00185G0011 [uncultured bacterium]|uniref:Uncharacterized protein n=2 Tax=Candidatus Wolfeibacteriota TaxID=1752735 RepID=A0A0G1HB49_9BACT|nr:MAG: hypothetical protein ACD_81C00185G0011 [uncultured bacterium]KKR12817.1 MAG: hypothetical protein UT41_C0001G0361 [Candidatus Wolfebacteria bacterium GW2011_GWC2_39_22]KKT43748.1 MAG: hypothetical protein UW32_C0001G0340 [Candidatus Wolfebacteria bacterium GW2011_GWE2_44_13]HBI25521.1 hypothetical protein [Candidatus Wolfebacteria bacterium]